MPPRSSSPICERSLDLTLIGIGRRDIPQCSPKHFLMEVLYRTFSGGRRPSWHFGAPWRSDESPRYHEEEEASTSRACRDGRSTVVPAHSGETLGSGLLHKILRDCQMTAGQLAELLEIGLLPTNALGSGRWVVRRRSPHYSRDVPIPERSGTASRKGPGLARPIRSVYFRLQNLACPGLRARFVAAWGQLPRRSPGCWPQEREQASTREPAPQQRQRVSHRLYLCSRFSRRSPETRCRCCRGRSPLVFACPGGP